MRANKVKSYPKESYVSSLICNHLACFWGHVYIADRRWRDEPLWRGLGSWIMIRMRSRGWDQQGTGLICDKYFRTEGKAKKQVLFYLRKWAFSQDHSLTEHLQSIIKSTLQFFNPMGKKAIHPVRVDRNGSQPTVLVEGSCYACDTSSATSTRPQVAEFFLSVKLKRSASNIRDRQWSISGLQESCCLLLKDQVLLCVRQLWQSLLPRGSRQQKVSWTLEGIRPLH